MNFVQSLFKFEKRESQSGHHQYEIVEIERIEKFTRSSLVRADKITNQNKKNKPHTPVTIAIIALPCKKFGIHKNVFLCVFVE